MVNSTTIADIFTLTRKLQAEGQDIADLSIGEPDFDTPDHIKQAAIEAIWRGETKYTDTDGTPALKAAIIGKYQREYGMTFQPSEVVADSGGKTLLANIFRALLQKNDRVITPLPCYGSYWGMIEILGAKITGIPCGINENFRLSPKKLALMLKEKGDKAKIFLLNNPNNPTGVLYSEAELRDFAQVLKNYPNLWIILDEVYEKLVYDGENYVSLLRVAPELRSRIIVVNSISKTYAMTGWRLGYALGSAEVMDKVRAIMAKCSANPCSITQAATVTALNGDHDYLDHWRESFTIRRNKIITALQQFPQLKTVTPQAGMFVYYHCGGLLGTKDIKTSNDLAAYFLHEAKVALVPGSAFGLDPYIRLSLVAPEQTIDAALIRLSAAIQRLKAS